MLDGFAFSIPPITFIPYNKQKQGVLFKARIESLSTHEVVLFCHIRILVFVAFIIGCLSPKMFTSWRKWQIACVEACVDCSLNGDTPAYCFMQPLNIELLQTSADQVESLKLSFIIFQVLKTRRLLCFLRTLTHRGERLGHICVCSPPRGYHFISQPIKQSSLEILAKKMSNPFSFLCRGPYGCWCWWAGCAFNPVYHKKVFVPLVHSCWFTEHPAREGHKLILR